MLFHELTHQVHTEHDAAFWSFMSALKKEADKLDWTKSAGRRLGGGGGNNVECVRGRSLYTLIAAFIGVMMNDDDDDDDE